MTGGPTAGNDNPTFVERRVTMLRNRWVALGAAVVAAGTIAACSGDSVTGQGNSRLIVRLTDAPLTDSVESVDMHIVRIEARTEAADSAASDSLTADAATASKGGWVTIAEPDKVIDILKLQDDTTTVGDVQIGSSTEFRAIRLILDPSKSSVTLKGGQKLTGTSSPGIVFPSGSRSGIKVFIQEPDSAVAMGDSTTTLVVDFDLEKSFVIRGNSISRNGLLFKPVIRAEVTEKE